MSNIFTSFNSAASSLSTYEKALEVVQNDTVNASTPGYVKQTVSFSANPFDINAAQAGGVQIGSVISSRDEYAEHNVQMSQSAYEFSSTTASHLSSIEPLFDLQSTTGVAGSLNSLFSAFSQLSISPNNTQARQSVINAASALATAFNVTSTGLANAGSSIDLDIQSTIKKINDTISDINNINSAYRHNASNVQDPGLDAQLHNDLETLSQYADITTVRAQDNTVSVFLGGQKPLLVGTSQYALSSSSSANAVTLLDPDGNDITQAVSSGQLGALIQMRNSTLPSYESQLDNLATAVSTFFNTKLAGGIDASGNPGAALFQIPASPASAAQAFAVTNIAPSQIAAASGASPNGNDNALTIANSQGTPIASLGNYTLTDYFGDISTALGRDVANAQSNQTTQQQVLAQAQSLRSQSSSVSLNEEAARLEEYQRAYQATSKLISVIDGLTQTLLGIMNTTGN